MSLSGGRTPHGPILPSGQVIATFGSYVDAQRAVDYLSDKAFPVQTVTIVGSDVRVVERVTGRLTYPKVAMAGLASGAWMGLFVGLLFMIFVADGVSVILSAVIVGGGFGLLYSVISYALTRGKRDFTSASQIVASQYAVQCLDPTAGQARELLRAGGFPTIAGGPAPYPAGSHGAGSHGAGSHSAGAQSHSAGAHGGWPHAGQPQAGQPQAGQPGPVQPHDLPANGQPIAPADGEQRPPTNPFAAPQGPSLPPGVPTGAPPAGAPGAPIGQSSVADGTTQAPAPIAPKAPSRPHPNFVDKHGRPLYGVRLEDLEPKTADDTEVQDGQKPTGDVSQP